MKTEFISELLVTKSLKGCERRRRKMFNLLNKLFFIIFYFPISSYCNYNNKDYFNDSTNLLITDSYLIENTIASNNDSIHMKYIEQLFKFEKDTIVNKHWYEYTDSVDKANYDIRKSITYSFYLSNQLVALYLISAIYYKSTTFCNYIIIKDTNGNRIRNLYDIHVVETYYDKSNFERTNSYIKYGVCDKNELIELYTLYKKWFFEVKKNGLIKMRELNNPPLKKSKYKWGD